MAPEESPPLPVRLTDLVEAFEFVSASQFDEHQAYICSRTGRIVYVSDSVDLEEEEALPEDPEEAGYLAIPRRQDLDLGRPVALLFAAKALPDSYDEVRDIFRRRGAFGRFKHLLRTKGVLDQWYAFDEHATQNALREWCDETGVPVVEDGKPA
jgi:Uncharacterised protein family (UPF0158)